MHISRLVIRNFRNFSLFDSLIQPGVTCILGENNTGKTNLLHALRLALDVNLPSSLRQLTENDVHLCSGLSTAQHVLVSVELKDYQDKPEQCALCGLWEVEANRARITYRFRPRQSVRETIERGERSPDSLLAEDYNWELTGGASGADDDPSTVEWDADLGHAVRFQELQAFKIDFPQALRDVDGDLRHSRTSPLNRLLEVLQIPQVEKDHLIGIIRQANIDVEASPTLHIAGDAIETAFADTAGEAFALPLRLGMVAPSFSSITRNLTILLTNGPVADFEPFRNGLGLNNILYISMLLEYFRRRVTRTDTAGQLLLIEEPEAHLHPQLQRVLYSKLQSSSFQTFITTHSTHISSASPLDSFIVLTSAGTLGTTSTVPSAIDNLRSTEKADLERYLDATRSTLLFARKVMLVEGPAEQFLIPILVKQVMEIDLERQGISVVPIHGVHFGSYAKLFCHNGLQKRCAIVTDGDLAPSDASNAGEDDPEGDSPSLLQRSDLDEFENEYLRVFSCETTFERTLAMPGMLIPLENACRELSASRIQVKIKTARIAVDGARTEAARARALRGLDSAILSTAKRIGKARFAQVVSKHATSATDLPQYIREAVNWLMGNEPHP